MLKKGILLYIFLIACQGLQAQKEDAQGLLGTMDGLEKLKDTSNVHWRKGGTVNLAGQQVSLTNWAAGGQSAISVNGLLSLFANYTKGRSAWTSNLEMAYGVIKQASNRKWWKNDDRLQLSTKYGYRTFDSTYSTILLDFKSQFAPGYNYPNDSVKISDLLAPAYIVGAMGLDYKPKKDVSFFLAPITVRITIVNDDSLAKYGAFGVQKQQVVNGETIPYKRARIQFGGYFKMMYKRVVMENVEFGTTLELFSDYLDNPQNLYVNWTTLTTLKVNKYISATVSTQMIYDEAVMITDKDGKTGPRLQFRQVLGIGLAYKF